MILKRVGGLLNWGEGGREKEIGRREGGETEQGQKENGAGEKDKQSEGGRE